MGPYINVGECYGREKVQTSVIELKGGSPAACRGGRFYSASSRTTGQLGDKTAELSWPYSFEKLGSFCVLPVYLLLPWVWGNPAATQKHPNNSLARTPLLSQRQQRHLIGWSIHVYWGSSFCHPLLRTTFKMPLRLVDMLFTQHSGNLLNTVLVDVNVEYKNAVGG